MEKPVIHMSRFTRAKWLTGVPIIALLCVLGLVSEGAASHTVSPDSLVFAAIQGEGNPTEQTLTVTKVLTTRASLTALGNAPWLIVSPASQYMTNRAIVRVAVNTVGLTAGIYTARVTIRESSSHGKVVDVTLVILSLPPPPPIPPATPVITVGEVGLTWISNTEADLAGYKLYWGVSPDVWQQAIVLPGQRDSVDLTGLLRGAIYYFALTAYDTSGNESLKSNVASKSLIIQGAP
jgi:hypothetical protein